MLQNIKPLTETPAWAAPRAHYEEIKDSHLRQLFADDPKRGAHFSAEGAGVLVHFSKNRIADETVRLLLALAQERGVAERRDAMFRSEKINNTEEPAVLLVTLRAPSGPSIVVDGKDVVPPGSCVLDKMADLSSRVRCGEWRATPAKPSATSWLGVTWDHARSHQKRRKCRYHQCLSTANAPSE